jgi:hypothetical protein
MSRLMITCREATRRLLQAQDQPLALSERLAMLLHQRLCRHCRRFAGQVALMRRAGERWRGYTQD